MKSIKSRLTRKAVKSTAKHTAHGATSKLRRQPLRTGALLGIGCVVGVVADRLVARGVPTPRADGAP